MTTRGSAPDDLRCHALELDEHCKPERPTPRLAVISVGEDSPYGHPAPATIATLDAHRVPVLRTDRDGDVEISVAGGRLTADPE
ncbi:MAG TPA: hypothetical protein VE401_02225 [Solirubrobacterales bacterium]|nr:hypothetical protein [Solirubrobacterales bacterium]